MTDHKTIIGTDVKIQERKEQTAYNMNQHKVNLIAKLQFDAEEALLNFKIKPADRIAIRYQCWQSIATLIDNRLSTAEKNKLIELQKEYNNNFKKLNPIKNKYIEGSDNYNLTQYIPNISRMKFYSTKYIKYVEYLMRKIGIDIESKDSKSGAFDS